MDAGDMRICFYYGVEFLFCKIMDPGIGIFLPNTSDHRTGENNITNRRETDYEDFLQLKDICTTKIRKNPGTSYQGQGNRRLSFIIFAL